jgi:hypothetical protein
MQLVLGAISSLPIAAFREISLAWPNGAVSLAWPSGQHRSRGIRLLWDPTGGVFLIGEGTWRVVSSLSSVGVPCSSSIRASLLDSSGFEV